MLIVAALWVALLLLWVPAKEADLTYRYQRDYYAFGESFEAYRKSLRSNKRIYTAVIAAALVAAFLLL